MSDEELELAFQKAKSNLRIAAGNGDGNEGKYAQAYQNLVKAGLRLQIKKKYR